MRSKYASALPHELEFRPADLWYASSALPGIPDVIWKIDILIWYGQMCFIIQYSETAVLTPTIFEAHDIGQARQRDDRARTETVVPA